MTNDLWLTCTLKFPGTYPPGDDGPGGGGEGGGKDDPPGGEPCDDSAIYWTCVSGGGGGQVDGGQSSGGFAYCVQAEFDVEDIDNDDCVPPPSFEDDEGVVWYSDPAMCDHLCENADGGGGNLGGGGGGAGGPGGPCVGKSYVCDSTSNTCSVFWMGQNHTCFSTLFNKNNYCIPKAAGPGVCTDGVDTYYPYQSDCIAACGGGSTCNYSCNVDKTSLSFGPVCIKKSDIQTINFTNTSTGGSCAGVPYIITYTQPNQFTVIDSNGDTSFSLSPGGVEAITVIFRAKNPGTYNSTITITGQGCSQVIQATGTAIDDATCGNPCDEPVWYCNPSTGTCDASSMVNTHFCFNQLFNVNDCSPLTGSPACTDTDGVTWYNAQTDCTAVGCEVDCEGNSYWCDRADPLAPVCTLYPMPKTDSCFYSLFDDICNRIPNAPACEQNGITYWNNGGNDCNANTCAPINPCTRYQCETPAGPNTCVADHQLYGGVDRCVEASTVYCVGSNNGKDEDPNCGCGGVYSPPAGGPYYADLETAAIEGGCISCGTTDFTCTDVPEDCAGNSYCGFGDLAWDATIPPIGDVVCAPKDGCYSSLPECMDPVDGCGGNACGTVDCPDFVICSETVCPKLSWGWTNHPDQADCGIGSIFGPEASVCSQGNQYNSCIYPKNETFWACIDSGFNYQNSCEDAYGDDSDRSIVEVYNDPAKDVKENGIYACNFSMNLTDPDNPCACKNVKINKCGTDPNTICGQESGKGFPDACWGCDPSFTNCCTQTAKGRRSSSGALVCPKSSYTTQAACQDSCTHNCWECDTSKTVFSYKTPCNTSCESIGKWSSSKEALENCDIEPDITKFEGYTQEVMDKIYRPDVIDSVFQRNYSNQKYSVKSSYTPIANRSKVNTTLFNDYIHLGILATNDLNSGALSEFSDFPYNNLSDSNIEKSLHKDLVYLLNNVKLATGVSIKSKILNSIRNLIISNRIDTIDGTELKESLQTILDKQGEYPDTRGTVTYNRGTHASEAKAIKLATEKSYFFKNDNYGELTNQRLKLWKTLATDLNKYLPVRGSNGTVTPFYFALDDTIVLDGSGKLTMSDGDLVKISSSDGRIKEIPVQGNYDRAKIIQIEDLQKIMYILGDTYDFKMEVTTDPTLRVDERYGVADARKDFYLLKAEVSGVTDLPRTNAFVAKTEVEYTYMDSSEARSDWVKFKPWPYMVFYVDWADPIISYIINDGAIKITCKDFVFDMFNNEELVEFPRRIPFTVAIIPTNKVDNLITPSISRQKSYGVREITFNVNPDPKKSDSWEPVYLKEQRSWPNRGVEETKMDDVFAIDYSMAPKQVEDSPRYQDDNVQPTTERPMFGMRQILKTLKEFKDNWVLRNNNRDVMWYDVYDDMDRSKMKFLFTECVDWENQKSLFSMGKISSDDTVNSNYPKVKDVKGNGKPIYDNFFTIHTVLEQKPLADVIPEPEPLP